jgi:branched-chain amino acid transport system permease protein
VREFINFGFSGLTTAAIYAIAASGLVLTYTTTGVFNFAHGAIGMFAAFTYWEMRFGWSWPRCSACSSRSASSNGSRARRT